MEKLKLRDTIILILLNLALFVGAGNIIFPPFIGLMAAGKVWIAAIGFFLTGVGMPVLAAIVMGPVNGSMFKVMEPMGKVVGTLLIVICYLCTGPMGATPRAATVAYDLSFTPFFHNAHYSWIYFVVYFSVIVFVTLHPTKLFEILGQILTPIKVVAIVALCFSVVGVSIDHDLVARGPYATTPFFEGLKQGYLTVDTFASLIFGTIMVNAIRSRGITKASSITFYVFTSAFFAGICLMIIYACLFRLGGASSHLVANPENGTDIIRPYVALHYGVYGKLLLAGLITIACIVAAIGVTSSGASYFSELTGQTYRLFVFLFLLMAFSIANLGLTRIIELSVPILLVIYPTIIILISLCWFYDRFNSPRLVAVPAAWLGFVFGLIDCFKNCGVDALVPRFYDSLPLAHQGLAWFIPCYALVAICFILDRWVLKGSARQLESA